MIIRRDPKPRGVAGLHCRDCGGPVTSLCTHLPMTARQRRRLAEREAQRREDA